MSTRGKVARPDGVEESLLLDNQLCFAAASRAVIRGYRPLLEQIGLTIRSTWSCWCSGSGMRARRSSRR